MDSLWKAIAKHLVTKRKVLAPKEIRFLRNQMDMTQADLAARLRVSDQTIARWEKGRGDTVPGPADIMLRVLYLASPRAQPEGARVLDKLMELIEKLVLSDEGLELPVVFTHRMRSWRETVCAPPQLQYA
jgi:DNA-binding transcriptional regulator YiaG